MGNAQATAKITKARAASASAEDDLKDLQHALGDATARLVEAEREAKTASNNLARAEAEVLMRKRIDVGAQFGIVVAEAARLYGEHQKLGAEILSMDVLPRTMHGTSNYEDVLGLRRVRACLPPFFWKLFPGALRDEMKTENLATAEARFWGLPPEEPDEKAKAA